MKSLATIVRKKPVYMGLFDSRESVKQQFDVKEEEFKKFRVLFGTYSYEDYSGSAYLLLTDGKKLYEVEGGHCSCYGLEGQFEPNEVVLDQLKARFENYDGYQLHGEEVTAVKKILGL